LSKSAEVILEYGKLGPQPDTSYTDGRDENTTLSQLITCPNLAVGWLFDGIGNNCLFNQFIDSVLDVGFASVFVDQCVDAAVFNCGFVPVESVSGEPHNLEGSGDIREFFGKIEKSNLVFYDTFLTMKREGYLPCFDFWFAPLSKLVSLTFSSEVSDQIETIP